jgi:ribonucleoside-diphosphate reductase alpha chain
MQNKDNIIKYSYEDAIKSSTDYFNGDTLAAKVFVDKYALRDNDGNIFESNPDQMHWRIANEFARIEKNKFK